MHQSVLDFGQRELTPEMVKGKHVLEVGSRNINGSLRPIVMLYEPKLYLGVDMVEGPDVDIVRCAEDLDMFEQFDLIICTEMLEHAENWRGAIDAMKTALSPKGYILITTRGPGFPYHEYPGDFWRYTSNDIEKIFADFDIELNANDPECPGVFVIAQKPADWQAPCDLSEIELAKP